MVMGMMVMTTMVLIFYDDGKFSKLAHHTPPLANTWQIDKQAQVLLIFMKSLPAQLFQAQHPSVGGVGRCGEEHCLV